MSIIDWGVFRIHVGDCIASMASMPAESVRCCVTSPPYFGLRDYGHEGQIGLEETPDAFVQKIVEVFREVRRVLTPDGTLWVNLGDSYASPVKGSGGTGKSTLVGTPNDGNGQLFTPRKFNMGSLKPKDLVGVPWRVAFALQADGWFLRQDIIWHKPNPMPESVRDRCTKAHEYLFLLSKAERYYFDSVAMQEPAVYADCGRPSKKKGEFSTKGEPLKGRLPFRAVTETRNRRSVWTVATRPYSGAHFATYPPALIEPCILAGSAPGDVVLDPFGGSGTTAEVAVRHGRVGVLCEINPDYAQLAVARVHDSLFGGKS